MTLPDKLTISRIFLTFIFMVFLFSGGLAAKCLALVVFLAASFTDFLDGFIARTKNISTDFGKFMDPIADKILVLAAFLAFVEMKLIPAWMVVIIILREITVTGLRVLALTKNKVIPSDETGRHKMVSQVVSIFAILLFLIFREAGIKVFNFRSDNIERVYKDAIFALMFITTVFTLISGINYLVKNKEIYLNAKNG